MGGELFYEFAVLTPTGWSTRRVSPFEAPALRRQLLAEGAAFCFRASPDLSWVPGGRLGTVLVTPSKRCHFGTPVTD